MPAQRAFAAIEKRSTSSRIVEAIREAVIAGEYAAGDALQSERDLAAQFGVTRATVRQALSWLAAEGLVEIRQGGVTRVKEVLSASPLILPFLLSRQGKLDPHALRDFLEVREALWHWVAERAAERATKEQLEALEKTVDRLEAARSAEDRQELDLGFFEQSVEMTHNRLLVLLLNPLRLVYSLQRSVFRRLFDAPCFEAKRYRRLFTAIALGKSDDAREAVSDLMRATRLAFDVGDRAAPRTRGRARSTTRAK